jgi:hypothetical protein
MEYSNMDGKHKHLEFIQNVITRMNTNSFLIKGWFVIILSALVGLSASTKKLELLFLAIVPALLFWLLDSYFLMQERKFRGLYKDAIDPSKYVPEFSMDISAYKDGEYKYLSAFCSETECLLYLPFILLIIIILPFFFSNCI